MRALQKEIHAAMNRKALLTSSRTPRASTAGFRRNLTHQTVVGATASLIRIATHLGPDGKAGAVFHPEMAEMPRPITRVVPDVYGPIDVSARGGVILDATTALKSDSIE